MFETEIFFVEIPHNYDFWRTFTPRLFFYDSLKVCEIKHEPYFTKRPSGTLSSSADEKLSFCLILFFPLVFF